MTRTVLLSLLFAVSWIGVSRADAISPDVYACNALSLGDSCRTADGVAGSCQKSTCYAKDMEHWDRDASGYPPSKPYDCLECIVPGVVP